MCPWAPFSSIRRLFAPVWLLSALATGPSRHNSHTSPLDPEAPDLPPRCDPQILPLSSGPPPVAPTQPPNLPPVSAVRNLPPAADRAGLQHPRDLRRGRRRSHDGTSCTGRPSGGNRARARSADSSAPLVGDSVCSAPEAPLCASRVRRTRARPRPREPPESGPAPGSSDSLPNSADRVDPMLDEPTHYAAQRQPDI